MEYAIVVPRMSLLDSIDIQLAKLLGQDARQSSVTLAKQLNLSAATVRRRLRKLLRSNSLRIVGAVDPTKFGLPMAVLITLDVSHDKLESAMEMLVNWPEIRWVSSATGRFDIIAFALFPSAQGLSDFLTNQLAKIKGLRGTETFVCLDLKKGRFISLA